MTPDPHIAAGIFYRRCIMILLTLLMSILMYMNWNNIYREAPYRFQADFMMLRHAAQGDPDWWERISGTNVTWQGVLYSDNQLELYKWTGWGPEGPVRDAWYILGTISYCVIAWRLCAVRNGFLIALVGLRVFTWLVACGNVALPLAALSCTPWGAIVGTFFKPNCLGPLAIYTFRKTTTGSTGTPLVCGSTDMANGSIRRGEETYWTWQDFTDQCLYIILAWFYYAYVLRDHQFYYRESWLGMIYYFLPL